MSWTPSAFAKRRMVESLTSVRPCSRAGRRGCGMLTSFARSACESPAASRASLSLVPNRTASTSRAPFRGTAARFFGDAFFLGGVVTGSLSHRFDPTRAIRMSLELPADLGAACGMGDGRRHGLRRCRMPPQECARRATMVTPRKYPASHRTVVAAARAHPAAATGRGSIRRPKRVIAHPGGATTR